jgi:hypothetical protein
VDRLDIIWSLNNYRVCNGSNWSGRTGNGMFGQVSSVRFAQVTGGLSQTAMETQLFILNKNQMSCVPWCASKGGNQSKTPDLWI